MNRAIRSSLSMLLALLLVVTPVSPGANGASDGFSADPKTAYAEEFIALCDGQQWFLEEIERILNLEQKTINRLSSSADLSSVVSLGFAGQRITTDGQAVPLVIPRAIGELTELRTLFLGSNELTSPLPGELFGLEKLYNIDLSYNAFPAMPIPAAFGGMKALDTLVLCGNQFTGNIPSTILSNTRIKVLDLSGNSLTNPIPADINNMTSLEYLALSDNKMAGTIPSLDKLTSLKTLSLWGMNLTGGIPDSVYTLTGLQVLDLAQNQLEDELDARLGNLTALQILALGDNKIKGSIPDELENLTELTLLDLADNDLRGVIPDKFAPLTKLEAAHLENNKLRGHVPDSLYALNNQADIYLQDNYMTGDKLAEITGKNAVGDADVLTNDRNFCDEARVAPDTAQYQLSSSDYVVINQTSEINLYSYLKNTPLGASMMKPLLTPDEYEIFYPNPLIFPEPFTVRRDANGIYIIANGPIPRSEALDVTIWIKDNNVVDSLTGGLLSSSALSTVTLKPTTETPPSGGPSGGAAAPKPEVTKTTEHTPYINGYPDGKFYGADSVTREQVAKMLAVAMDLAETRYTGRYSDVAVSHWSAQHIAAATKYKYFVGYPDGSFQPQNDITRAEFVAVVARVAGLPLEEDITLEELSFSDVEDAWYLPYLAATVEAGYIDGYPDGTFQPDTPIQRNEAVKVMNMLLGRNVNTQPSDLVCPFPDVETDDWAYKHILEASVKHNHVVED